MWNLFSIPMVENIVKMLKGIVKILGYHKNGQLLLEKSHLFLEHIKIHLENVIIL